MTNRAWLRFGAACGILGVVLLFVGFGLFLSNFVNIDSQGQQAPGGFLSRESMARYIAQPINTGGWVGLYLETLAAFVLFVFAARLWVRLRRAEGDPAWLAAIALGAQLGWLCLTLISLAAEAAIYVRAGQGADVTIALTLNDLQRTTYFMSWALTALFLGATAAVALGAHALPRWLGWSAAGIAVLVGVALLAPTSDLAQNTTFLVVFWIAAASIVLLRQGEEARPAVSLPSVTSSVSAG